MAVASHYELSSEFLTKLQDTLIELYLGGRVMVLNFKKEVVSEVVVELRGDFLNIIVSPVADTSGCYHYIVFRKR